MSERIKSSQFRYGKNIACILNLWKVGSGDCSKEKTILCFKTKFEAYGTASWVLTITLSPVLSLVEGV